MRALGGTLVGLVCRYTIRIYTVYCIVYTLLSVFFLVSATALDGQMAGFFSRNDDRATTHPTRSSMRDRLQSISRAPDWMPTRYFINGRISVSARAARPIATK